MTKETYLIRGVEKIVSAKRRKLAQAASRAREGGCVAAALG
jgi:hypothetical protein